MDSQKLSAVTLFAKIHFTADVALPLASRRSRNSRIFAVDHSGQRAPLCAVMKSIFFSFGARANDIGCG